jgi:hypothetical protein
MHFIGTNHGRLHETSGYLLEIARTHPSPTLSSAKDVQSRREREFQEYVEEASWWRRTIALAFADERET